MTTLQPKGENLRRAVKWIAAERRENPDAPLQKFIDQACMTYNLTPAEADYLDRLVREGSKNSIAE